MHSTLDWESYNGSSSTTLTEVAKNKARTFSVDSIMALQLEAEVLEFPGHATTTYLNEGAANIVYSIKVPHAFHTPGRHCQCGDEKTTCINEPWHGKLLRFRKDLPTTSPTLVAHNHFLKNVAPLFPSEDLIDIKVALVGPSGIVQRLNKELKLAEQAANSQTRRPLSPTDHAAKPRHPHRHGTYLANDSHALLITDMSPSPTTRLIQFKPKWLYPSFSAPSGSKRCRTCALHARRNHLRQISDPPSPAKRGFCPLDLVSKDDRDVERAAIKILHLDPSSHSDSGKGDDRQQAEQLQRFVDWARNTSLLTRIQKLQRSHDPSGILHVIEEKLHAAQHPFNAEESAHLASLESKMQIAMTLRDVTLFLLMPKDGDRECVARLGDLDLKSKGKLEAWEKIERQLIEEGWYEGNEEEHGFTKQALDCWLYPEEWTHPEEKATLKTRKLD